MISKVATEIWEKSEVNLLLFLYISFCISLFKTPRVILVVEYSFFNPIITVERSNDCQRIHKTY